MSWRGAAEERREREELARGIRHEASAQWQKTGEGVVALPAAIALGTAASIMTFAGFLARGFEVFTRSAHQTREDWRQLEREQQRPAGANPPSQQPTSGTERGEREPKGPDTPRA